MLKVLKFIESYLEKYPFLKDDIERQKAASRIFRNFKAMYNPWNDINYAFACLDFCINLELGLAHSDDINKYLNN